MMNAPACISCHSHKIKNKLTKNQYKVCVCGECGLQFVDPIPSFETISAIYSADYFKRGGKYAGEIVGEKNDPNLINNQAKLKFLQNYAQSGHLLDVGCAQGEFIALACQQGFDAQGVELSADASALAREKFGVTVQTGTLVQANLPEAYFDVITLWDVIEHLDDPRPTLARAHALLKPGGLLVLTTGDAGSAWARMSGRYWQLMTPPHHLYFYNKKSITALLNQFQFEIQGITHHGKKATLDFILFKATESFGRWVLPLRQGVQRLGLARRTLSVNLYDIMTVVARRN